jgi:hypothetical protein
MWQVDIYRQVCRATQLLEDLSYLITEYCEKSLWLHGDTFSGNRGYWKIVQFDSWHNFLQLLPFSPNCNFYLMQTCHTPTYFKWTIPTPWQLSNIVNLFFPEQEVIYYIKVEKNQESTVRDYLKRVNLL